MEGELKAGRYKMGARIGDPSGMGDVYRAHDTQTDSPVALKFIKPEYLSDPQFRLRMALEVRAAANISHPCIARALGFFDEGKECFAVFEFVEGETLRKLLAERSFTVEEILDIGIKVADALEAAHAKRFLHRDLKPANIMYTRRPGGFGWVKILDFGLAKRMQVVDQAQAATAAAAPTERITTQMSLIGTIEYMAPEQVRMEEVDQRTDLHALGLILYELATRVNPFLGDSRAETIAYIQMREAPPVTERNPSIPAGLDHIIRKCLRKKREDRYQSAGELLVDLTTLRRELARPSGAKPALPASAPEAPLTISRTAARVLFLVIQLGYLALYVAAAHYLPRHVDRIHQLFGAKEPALAVPFLALMGAAVRLYFLAAVGFDYADSGRLFRRLFVFIACIDVIWAMSPLLLFQEIEWLALLCVVGLASLVFSQRSLLYSAYAPRGGKTSGVGAATPA